MKDRKGSLLERKQQLEARIAELERRDHEQARKDDTRFKILLGAALLSDAANDNNKQAYICSVLGQCIRVPRDHEFVHAVLQKRGWLA